MMIALLVGGDIEAHYFFFGNNWNVSKAPSVENSSALEAHAATILDCYLDKTS